MPPQRLLYTTGLVVAIGLLIAAYYFQYVKGLEPCPLCILQRLALMALALALAAALLHNPGPAGRRAYGLVLLLAAGAGEGVAARQVWLQQLPPDQVPACGPGLDYMLEVFPPAKVLSMVLQGSGECAEVAWRLLGLSMAGWMTVVFAAYLLLALLLIIAPRRLRAD